MSPASDQGATPRRAPALGAFLELAHHLEEHGVRWALLHDLPLSDNGDLDSDVDLIVDDRDCATLESTLLSHSGLRLIQVRHYEFTSRTYICEEESGAVLCIDVSTDIRASGRVFISSQEALRDRVVDDRGLWIVSPGLAFGVYALRRILKYALPIDDALPDTVRHRLEQQYVAGGDASDTWARALLGDEVAALVTHAARDSAWTGLEAREAMRASVLRRTKGRRRLAFWAGEARRALDRVVRPEGVMIAVLGPDGVGKSAVIAGMIDGLSTGFARTETLHLRPYALAHGVSSPSASDEPHGRAAYGPLKSLAKIAYWTVDYCAAWVFTLRPRIVRCSLIVFDRYLDDALVDRARYSYGGPKWAVELARHLIPRPAVVLILDAPAEIVAARKAELDEQTVSELRRGYAALATTTRGAVLIDASAKLDDVVAQSCDAVRQHLHRRALRRLSVRGGSHG